MSNIAFYKQMLKRNVLLIFTFNIIFCTIIYCLYANIAGTEIMKEYESEFIQKVNAIDAAISTAQEIAIMIRSSSEIKEYVSDANSNPYLKFRAMSFLNNTIGNMSSSRLYMACFKETGGSVLSTLGTMTFGYFEQKTGIPITNKSEINKYFIHSSNLGIALSEYTYNAQTISTITFIKKDVFPNGETLYTLTSYDIDAMTKMTKGTFIITYNSSPFYYNGISQETAEKIAQYDHLKGYKYFVRTAEQSNIIGDFRYIFAVPYLKYFMQINKHFWLALPLSTIVLLLSFFIIHSITNKNYEPIHNILNIINESDGNDSADEIDTITNTILSLNTSNSKLKNIIDSYRLPLENIFLSDLLCGNITDSEVEEKLMDYNLNKPGPFVAIIIDYSNNENLTETISKEGILTIKDSVSEFFKNYYKKNEVFKIIDTDFWYQTIIISIENYENFVSNLRHTLLKLEGKMNIIIFAYVGKPVQSMKDIYLSYNSAKTVLQNNKPFTSHSAVCSINDSIEKNISFIYPPSTENRLIEYVLNGNREKVHSMISDIVNFEGALMSKEQFSLIVVLFNSTINRILFLLKKSAADIFGPNTIVYLELKSCTNREMLQNTLFNIFDTIINYVQSEQYSNEEKISKAMIEYIHNNYMKDISLLDLAEHLNMSQSYVSRLFKSLNGYNFKEYLNRHRFIKAKELMDKNPTMKVKDVAKAVGFNSSDSLSRIFLKYQGVTASDYIKK